LRGELENLLAARTAADWTKALSEVRVPAGVVNDVAGAFALAHDLGLNPIVAIPRGDGSVVELCRNPMNLSATPPDYRCAPPEFPVT
jgi:crotonobetainyl-CoA:carnitine CoA-transferase CaiB-like acyl-CoA transferase